jgi:hypothetical protein
MVDGDYSCNSLPQEFYYKQREAYMLYYSLMTSHGYNINHSAGYDPWAPKPTSKYAYAEYIPGENPYLGRWKSHDYSCWITPKDAYRMNMHAVEVADNYVHKIEDDYKVTVHVEDNQYLNSEEVVYKPSFAEQMNSMRSVYEYQADNRYAEHQAYGYDDAESYMAHF